MERFGNVRRVLEKNGATDLLDAFVSNEVDDDALPLMTEAALKDIGVPVGTRLKLLRDIAAMKTAAESERRNSDDRNEDTAALVGGDDALRRRRSGGSEQSQNEPSAAAQRTKRNGRTTASRRVQPCCVTRRWFVDWAPALGIVALFSPLGIYVIVELLRDMANDQTNDLFLVLGILYFVFVGMLAFVCEYFWLPYVRSGRHVPVLPQHRSEADDE